MSTHGIEGLYLETHSWARTVAYLTGLGFTVDLDTGHGNGRLVHSEGPYIFVVQVPDGVTPTLQPVLAVPNADAFSAGDAVAITAPFRRTHFGTLQATATDPDQRPWLLQAPVRA